MKTFYDWIDMGFHGFYSSKWFPARWVAYRANRKRMPPPGTNDWSKESPTGDQTPVASSKRSSGAGA